MIELDDLRVFERVAALGGFSAAARALTIPKSSASRAIGRLEAGLGIRLLQRTTRRVGLTVAGRALLEQCGAHLAGLDDALAVAGSFAAAPRGTLRLSAGIGVGINVLGAQLPAFLERYPDVRVSLDLTSRAAELVSEGIDVAIRMGPLPDSELVATQLGTLTQYLCATPAYLDRAGRPKLPAELDGHALIELPSASGKLRPWRLTRGNCTESYFPTARVEVNDALTVAALVKGGAGIGVVTAYLCAPGLLDGSLERVLPDWSLPPLPVNLVFPSRREMSPTVRAFVEFMREANADRQGWLANPIVEPLV